MAKKVEAKVEEQAKATGVVLKNTTRRYLVFNLSHEQYCDEGACGCEKRSRVFDEHNYLENVTTQVVRDHFICQSIGWLAGEAKEVDQRTLKVPAIARAIRQGELLKVG